MVPAINKEIIISSLIPCIPAEILVNKPIISKLPYKSPITPANTIPPININITFIPINADINTAMYGSIFIKLYS